MTITTCSPYPAGILGRFLLALDSAARAIAWALSHWTRIEGAGVCWDWWRGRSDRWAECWREEGARRGAESITLRLGKLELIVDLGPRKERATAA